MFFPASIHAHFVNIGMIFAYLLNTSLSLSKIIDIGVGLLIAASALEWNPALSESLTISVPDSDKAGSYFFPFSYLSKSSSKS